MAISLSDEAEADIESIWLYSMQEFGEDVSVKFLKRLDYMFELLNDFPDIGLKHPAIANGMRYFPMRTHPFLMFFTREENDIRIIRIFPDKMQIENHLQS